MRQGTDEVAHSDAALNTYAEADGSHTTRALYLVFFVPPAHGSAITLGVDAAGQVATVDLTVE